MSSAVEQDTKLQDKASELNYEIKDVIKVQSLFRGRKARQMLSGWSDVVHQMRRMLRLRDENVRARNMLALVHVNSQMKNMITNCI